VDACGAGVVVKCVSESQSGGRTLLLKGRKSVSQAVKSAASKQARLGWLAVGGSGTTFTDTGARERGQHRAKESLRHTERGLSAWPDLDVSCCK
jgi:hypothetical protein